MFNLEVENKNGVKLKLSQNEDNYQIIGIEGVTPPSAEIVTSKIANFGEKFKSSRMEMRNIVLTICLKGEIEKNRIQLYSFFSPSQMCKLYYSNGTRDIFVECYCETVETDLFSQSQTVQISLICPSSYLVDFNTIVSDISKMFNNFEFPFAISENGVEFSKIDLNREVQIINKGDVKTGIIIKITANADNITNPVIYNSVNGDYIQINDTLNNGEIIVIDTNRTKKTIKKIIDTVETNILGKLKKGSTWLELDVGNNYFTYSADGNSELLSVIIEHNPLYIGA